MGIEWILMGYNGYILGYIPSGNFLHSELENGP